jgi:nitrate reductase NapE component
MIYLIAAFLMVAIVALYYVIPSGDRKFVVTATFVMIAIVLWAVMLASFVVGK